MKKIIFLIFCVGFCKVSFATWINLNSGINDNLTGVAFFGNNGVVSGHHGLYYTTTGGSGSVSWSRFNITGNQNDSILYNNIKFTHTFSNINIFNTVFACGYDTVNNKAIIMKFNFPSLTYSFIYIGPQNSKLNNIGYSSQGNSFYAVGDSGLIVRFTSSTYSVIPTNFNYDLSSISIGGEFSIGCNGNMINGSLDISGNLSFRIFSTPGNNYKGVISTGYNYNYAVGNSYFNSTGGYPMELPNYDFGPLNANALFSNSSSNVFFVGTDHGIFKSDVSKSFLEYQPSSMNYKINGFAYYNSVMYACGENGVLLSSTTNGGITKPYAKINLPGGCLGTNISIGGITGTQTYCQWFINNTQVSWTCGSFNHIFNAVGQYTIQVNVANSSNLYDTAVQVINIVDYPKINKPVVVNDNILCHQEPIVITVDSSQLNVFYKLKKFGNSNDYGYSGIGNSSIINFTSTPLSVAGNYYLEAKSSLASCYKNFTDTIKISIEKTLATFHVGTINANPGEPINCFQHCNEAQNFSWTFSPNANTLNSSLPTPTVSFSSVGPTQIKLIAWSNNGCYDSIQKPGPTIYNEPVNDDSCWAVLNSGIDPPWEGHYDSDIAQMTKSKTGFLICGKYYKQNFASRFGDTLNLSGDSGGAYIAKYNKNGVLKWINYSKQYIYSGQPSRSIISTVVEDKLGNIYYGGYSGLMFDNTGTSTFYPYIAKLDSTGKLLWKMGGILPTTLSVDPHNNLLCYSTISSSGTATITLNGAPVYTISFGIPCLSFIKINSSGMPLWNVKLYTAISQQNKVNCITTDKNCNIYLNHRDNNNFYISKYDSSGIHKWNVISYGSISNSSLVPYWMATDSIGNSYVSGSNYNFVAANTQNVTNSDGTTMSQIGGKYFIMKVNPSGICKWINAEQYSYYGRGQAICLDGDEVSVHGMIANNSATTQTSIFTSQNNINASLTMEISDNFIAVYDTLGNLKRVVKNVSNSFVAAGGIQEITGFYKENNCYFLAQNNGLGPNFMNFGTIMPATNGMWDGFITKFTENCGSVSYPDIYTNQKNVQKNGLLIYPNPTRNLIYVKGLQREEKVSYKILNVAGQELLINSSTDVIDIGEFKPGMYFLFIYKDNKLYHQEKIIKE